MDLSKLQVSEITKSLWAVLMVLQTVPLNGYGNQELAPELEPFPTRAFLIHRGVNVVAECAWCTRVDESLEHLMCACLVSANVWSGVGAILGTKCSFADINELISHSQRVLVHTRVCLKRLLNQF